jgi:hypothetical protein
MIRDISIDHRLQQTVQPPLRAVLPSWPTFRVDPLKCGGVVALESLPWSVVGCDVSCQWSHNLDLDLDRASTSGAHGAPIQRGNLTRSWLANRLSNAIFPQWHLTVARSCQLLDTPREVSTGGRVEGAPRLVPPDALC